MEQPNFNKPQIGIGMTPELGSRPWQSPPQLVKVEEVIDYYVTRMSDEEASLKIGNILDLGVPVTTLSNTIMLGNVMEGLHTLDTGILALPAMMEFIMMVGDAQEIDYVTGVEDDGEVNPDIFAERAMNSLLKNKIEDLPEESVEGLGQMLSQEEPQEPPMGLMSRRT